MRKPLIRPGLIPLWMLNDASRVPEKNAYMRACRAGGIEALAMHPRAGNLIPYASTEWFEMVRELVEEGKRLGMSLWLYDEDPFPSGAAGGLVMANRPDLIARCLRCYEAPASLRPGELWPITPNRVLWAGLAPARGAGAPTEMTASVGPVRAEWFMGRWDSRYYYSGTRFPCPRGSAQGQQMTLRVPVIPKGHKLIAIGVASAGVDGSWDALPDLLHPDAFRVFRELTLDPYEEAVGRHFGRTIPGVFTDEAKPHGSLPAPADLFDGFARSYGYDLRPRLYQLFGDALNAEYERARVDYRRWVFGRFMDHFVRPYRRWCDERGLLLAGHFSPEDEPFWEAWCALSVMPIMQGMSCAGTDVIVPYVGDARTPVMNIGSLRAASVRTQEGQPYACSESLALSGWDVTSRLCRRILAWQKVLGIDRFFPHGFFTSNEGVQIYEAPPDYGPYTAIFPGIGVVNEWLKTVDRLTDGARDVVDVAILNSVKTFWTWGPGADESRLRAMQDDLLHTVLACLRAQVGVHFVDEDAAATWRVRDGKLRVGRAEYSTVLVPNLDFVDAHAFRALSDAAARGVSVFWFGGGPRRVCAAGSGLSACPRPKGTLVPRPRPGEAWCRRHLRSAAVLRGARRSECYVRRFRAAAGGEYLLAVNVAEAPIEVALGPVHEPAGVWCAERVDGDVTVRGGRTVWRAPEGAAGLFRLGAPVSSERVSAVEERTIRLAARTFARVGPNLLRLNTPWVWRSGDKPVRLKEPYPYWQVFQDYSVDRSVGTFAGRLPVESRVPNPDLRYAFDFDVRGEIGAVTLILDPRCARGRFGIFLNGIQVGGKRLFPLPHTRPLRIGLRMLRSGRNRIELRFDARNAMEGLLSQLYIEGEFDVDVRGAEAQVGKVRGRVGRRGWQAAGMPHYMGSGVYRWRETFADGEPLSDWRLELDEITDNAELRVNGRPLGRLAWPPWRWTVPDLRAGVNAFELRVSGTAGNKHELDWPAQPQGWVGGGRLVRMSTGEGRG